MIDEVQRLIQEHRETGVLIDTNILVMLLVGAYDPDRIPLFSRTSKYIPDEFELVAMLLEAFKTQVTTTSVLTEVSNLVGYLFGSVRDACFELFARHLDTVQER